MVGCWQKSSLVFLGVLIANLGASTMVIAQESDSILGFWKQKTDSVYINIKQEDGKIHAEMIRNDWSPGLVGIQIFQNLTTNKKNKWTGSAYVIGETELDDVSVSFKGGNEFSSKVKRQKKIKWVRTDPIEKRY